MTATRSSCSSTGRVRTGSPVSLTTANLSHRYLWGPAVDQVLADEQVTSGGTDAGQRRLDPDGQREHGTRPGDLQRRRRNDGRQPPRVFRLRRATSQTNPQTGTAAAVDCLFGFAGMAYDEASGTNVTPTRRYDPNTGRWDSPDTDGFKAGDTNLYRYCGNSPTNATDPNGTEPKVAAAILQALARGDIQLALQLLAGIGYKGLNLVPAFLQKLQEGMTLADGRCGAVAARAFDLFTMVGEHPVILEITDEEGELTWEYFGEVMTDRGFHLVCQNGNRVYDLITGPFGEEMRSTLTNFRRPRA